MSIRFSPYLPHRSSTVEQLTIRGAVPYRVRRWAPEHDSSHNAPPLLLTHGWMDVGASFQRCVDYLSAGREIIALDWRGFGGSRSEQPIDSYWFHDYYRSEEHTSELQSLMRISYAVFCLKKKN